MKKSRLLNAELSTVVAQMGHLDELTICDAGLPIPNSTQRIDLAISRNLPPLIPVLEAVLRELRVESVLIAAECKLASPDFYRQLLEVIDAENHEIAVELISHDEFKVQTSRSRAVVRTGECTSFANIILKSGVTF